MFVLSPLREFSFIFRCKVCSAAGGNIKKLEILPRLHFKGQKVLNDRMKLENNKATPSENSALRRDGTSSCVRYPTYGQKLQIFYDSVVSQFPKET